MVEAEQHYERISNAVQAGDAVRSFSVASWQRCLNVHKLDPSNSRRMHVLSQMELNDALEQSEILLHVSSAALDDFFKAVEEIGCCVLLSDANGIPLSRRGSQADLKDLTQWGLSPGVNWSEPFQGTNGIGTALVEGRCLTVRRDQHFYVDKVNISCIAAPIFDAEAGINGVLNVTLYKDEQFRWQTQIVQTLLLNTVRQIEERLFRHAYASARFVSLPEVPGTGLRLLALDPYDMVIGATRAARHYLGIVPKMLKEGLVAGDLLNDRASDDFAQAELGVIQRGLRRNKGNVSATADSLGVSRATMKRKITQYAVKKNT